MKSACCRTAFTCFQAQLTNSTTMIDSSLDRCVVGSSATSSSFTSRLARLALWSMPPLGFGLLALWLGQDANWDLRNYHFYNAYAFLNGRLDFDIAPAQTPTYYNPLLHVPFYYLVTYLPPRAVGFVLGALQGLNLPFLYGIARPLVRVPKPCHAALIALLIALLGSLGAANISEVGTVFGDNIISLLVLGALWLIVAKHVELGERMGRAVAIACAAGLLAGLAVGLKQPAAVYGLGLGLAILGLSLPWPRRLMLLLAFGLGATVGFVPTGGYWLYVLWTHYGNPLFPYFNSVFHSPMASLADYRDMRFLPEGWREWLFFPLVFALDPAQTAEGGFRDLRIPLLYCLLLVLLLHTALTSGKTRRADAAAHLSLIDIGAQRALLVFGLVSYLAWLKMFAIYRYLVTIEMLAPLGIWLILAYLFRDRHKTILTAGACGVLMLVFFMPLHWGRVPWSDDYFGVVPPPVPDPSHTMILMAGHEPSSYLIPFFPPQIRFLRIQSYFTGPSATPNGTDLLMQRLVSAHHGPLYILYRGIEQGVTDSALRAYGLSRRSDQCATLHPHIEAGINDQMYFCRVTRIAAPRRLSMDPS